MPTRQRVRKNETESAAALYSLLRKIDSESTLPYTAVEEVRAMVGENIITKMEAIQIENKAGLDALRIAVGENKGAIAENKAAIVANKAAIVENTRAIDRFDATLKAHLDVYAKQYWALVWILGSIAVGAILAVLKYVFRF